MDSKKIPVTIPFLPPFERFSEMLTSVWDNRILTNSGPNLTLLEEKLRHRFSVDNLLIVNNGTIALQMAIKALDLKGEIITTPYSFIATTSSIIWEGIKPVYVDIERTSLNIDVSKIEEKITPETSAILATHVYGNPCNIEEIDRLAKKYNLKVIYDGAHAFDVTLEEQSIFKFGDISTCSLHSTKLFHMVEGGFITCRDDDLFSELMKIRNFGISENGSFFKHGTNGKNSEFHSIMGLLNLEYIDEIKAKRKDIFELYLNYLDGLNIEYQTWAENSRNNHAYFPLILKDEKTVLNTLKSLQSANIYARRYFYPELSSIFNQVNNEINKNAEYISRRVLCLPIYPDLKPETVKNICSIIKAEL